MRAALLPRLPRDLTRLVLQHWGASVLQAAFLRWHRLRHVRTPEWRELRARLPRAVHARLVRYHAVRREWRREPRSWIEQSDADLDAILSELDAATDPRDLAPLLWGAPAPR